LSRRLLASTNLSARQQREIEFSRRDAEQRAVIAEQPVNLEPAIGPKSWRTRAHPYVNAYWVILRKARELELPGTKVLVLGCGFGEDALQLAWLGARVSAADLSAESVAIARKRATREIAGGLVDFTVCPAEQLPYADHSFHLVYISDVAHHFDIPVAMREVRRVLKPGGVVLANEPYTHSWMQAIRLSRFVRERIYPKLIQLIYRSDRPHVTADERKLDQRDMAAIGAILTITDKQYYSLLYARLTRWQYQLILDRLLLRLPLVGYFLAGRVVFTASSAAIPRSFRTAA
jgi:ubiquinone/menaquinone biosynthesis C-methylase UbiE